MLPFPGAAPTARLGAGSSRRWISAAAAAGLLVGLLTGQLLHVMPGDNWVHPERTSLGPPPSARINTVPGVVKTAVDADDALLDAIDIAVNRPLVTDLRAFADLTFSEPD